MYKLLQKSLLTSPAVVGAALIMSGAVLAGESPKPINTKSTAAESLDLTESFEMSTPAVSDIAVAAGEPASEPEATPTLASDSSSEDILAQISAYSDYNNSVQVAQVTYVSELSDVQTSDWAFKALQRLVEEYDCIEGYPNQLYRGRQTITRYEFAAGLDSCLNVVLELVGASTSIEDLATIQRLQGEFQAELSTLRGRVDVLEADVAELEANQFSTTTKLRGEVTAHFNAPLDRAIGGETATFEYRARLNFDTSFTGEDRLRLRFQSGTNNDAPLGFPEGFDDSAGGDNDIEFNDVYYSFPLGDRLEVIIAGNSIKTNNFVASSIVPFDGVSVGDAGEPLFYDFEMGGDSGLGFSYSLTDALMIDAGYSVDADAIGNPNGQGIFSGGGQSYIAQISYLSDDFIDAGFAFLHGNDDPGDRATNTFAGLVNFDLGRFEVGGYGAFHDQDGSDEESFSWQAGVSIPDLFFEGNTFGVYVGQAPTYEEDEPFFAEAYYEMELNEYLSITPAILYAEENNINDSRVDSSSVYGVVRAVFRF